MINKVREIIEKKVKNLHPDVEKKVIDEALKTNLKCKYKILQFIRKMLELPSVGSDKKIYWIKRGWSEEEADLKRVIKKMPTSPFKIENWLNKVNEITGELYTEEEALYKMRSFRKCNKEYWLEKGYSEIESKQLIKEFQKENSIKFIRKSLSNPEKYLARTETQLKYWIEKGYSEVDAKEKLSYRQNTTSLSKYVKRYGDELGLIKYKKRIDKMSYISSRDFYVDKYGNETGNLIYNEILSKRTVGFNKSSKEAFLFLLPIYKFIRNEGIEMSDVYWGVGSSNEWFIKNDKSIFFYDFFIKPLNIIIEYHGVAFHPKRGDENWTSPHGVKYDFKIKIDDIKRELAVNSGFDYLYVYSDDNLKTKQIEFIEYIKLKLYK